MDARDAMISKCHVPTVDIATSNRIRDAAYKQMVAEMRDAWRK